MLEELVAFLSNHYEVKKDFQRQGFHISKIMVLAQKSLLFSSWDWNWNAGGILHMPWADIYQEMGFTRIWMISSGVLSSTGIPFTSFNSSPTWISPSTHKHKCKFPQNVTCFFFLNVIWILCCGVVLRHLKRHIHVDWHVIYDWKASITNHFHSFQTGMNNRQDKMSTRASRKH